MQVVMVVVSKPYLHRFVIGVTDHELLKLYLVLVRISARYKQTGRFKADTAKRISNLLTISCLFLIRGGIENLSRVLWSSPVGKMQNLRFKIRI